MNTLAQLNRDSDDQFVAQLSGVYEHSPWVAEAVRKFRPFPDLETLRLAMQQAVDAASPQQHLILIRAHPDLAGKLARAGGLTACSTREQSGLGLDCLSDEAYQNFSDKNSAYREKFGFPFIICARKSTQELVLKAFELRLENSRDAEIGEALRQIHDIARLRIKDLLT